MLLHRLTDSLCVGLCGEDGGASTSSLDSQALVALGKIAMQPVVHRLLAAPEQSRNLFRFTPLRFEQNDLATLAKRMAVVSPLQVWRVFGRRE